MSKETDREVADLMVQCESALIEYSNRTGAPVFADASTPRSDSSVITPKPASEQALVKMTASLKTARADSEYHITKLEAKITAETDTLSSLKRQQDALSQQARQADLANKRKALYRTPESESESYSDTRAASAGSGAEVQHRSVALSKSSPNLRRPK
jgi:hypothetical protein